MVSKIVLFFLIIIAEAEVKRLSGWVRKKNHMFLFSTTFDSIVVFFFNLQNAWMDLDSGWYFGIKSWQSKGLIL